MDAFDNGNSSQASSGSSGSKRPSPTIQATNSKKNKHSDQLGNETDATIEAKRVKGVHFIPVINCIAPAPSRLLRKVDRLFVEGLKQNMCEDPTAPGIPPIAVLCKDIHIKETNDFNLTHKKVYRYEVLGGLHSVTAWQELLQDHPGYEAFKDVSSIIYCGLTDDESLRLAARHNINGHFTHAVTHHDYLDACRARLFTMANKDSEKDATPFPSTEWKKRCQQYILPTNMSKTQRENILNQASFSSKVWMLTTQVMNAFEKGQLKGQSQPTNKTQLTNSIKQHHLQPLHHLEEDFQMDMLQMLLQKKISFGELRQRAMSFRALEAVKGAFVRTTDSNNWETARDRFPHHAVLERLKTFTNLSFKGGLPSVFKDYCRSAMLSTESASMDTATKTTFSQDGCTVSFLKAESTSQTGEHIKRHLPDFCGANLMFAVIAKEMETEQITSLAYTAREINRIWTNIEVFNFIILSDMEDKSRIESSLSCFDSVEHAYAYNTKATGNLTSNLSAGLTMSQALRLITVGHWAQNGKISPQHIRGEVSNVLDHATQEELLFKILDTFSFVGNTVINMTGDATNGQFAVSCLRGGRDGIVFYQDPDIGATATGSLAEYLYLLDEDKKNKEVVEEVEEIEE